MFKLKHYDCGSLITSAGIGHFGWRDPGPVLMSLSEEEHVLLKNELSSKILPKPFGDSKKTFLFFIKAQEKVSRLMSENIISDLVKMKLGLFTPSYYLVTGLPIDEELPPTPLDGSWPEEKKTYISEAILLGISGMLGIPYGFAREKDGRIINQISPIPGKEESQTSASATIDLGSHVEIAYHHSIKPRFLILLCLRQDREQLAATTLIDMRWVIKNLPDWVKIELRKTQFQFKMPDSFANATVWSAARPILAGPISNPEVIFDSKACQVIFNNPLGVDALKYLENEMKKQKYLLKVYLKPGNALIIPNNYVVHGRSEFTPHFDGFDRWLQRVYVVDSIYGNRENMSEKLLVFDK